ncbi:hypothetical protein [Aliiglaciecola sp. M165]|uniref:hypothetical protein n=1 Tax=Aliiglaciecola sp. M165 TaxID=2593649 RepID=UPI00117D13AF|nr:hypothetical protein [Aliiglaciecola sp. M165]TRY28667.1 hypothetical protein FM019_20620 [Aliiglaciecola sp. M165]
MKEIEGLEHALEVLRPRWDEFNAHFESENQKFIELLNQDHDVLGRVLKAHLILEHYLTIYLQQTFKLDDLASARLSFSQKVTLLPTNGTAASSVKLGLKRLNRIRNEFAHRLNQDLEQFDVNSLNEVIQIFRPDTRFDSNLARIEAFVTIAVTFLIVPPASLQQTFADAFVNVRAYDHDL